MSFFDYLFERIDSASSVCYDTTNFMGNYLGLAESAFADGLAGSSAGSIGSSGTNLGVARLGLGLSLASVYCADNPTRESFIQGAGIVGGYLIGEGLTALALGSIVLTPGGIIIAGTIGGAVIASIVDHYLPSNFLMDPLVIDLNADGNVSFSGLDSSRVMFDMDGDGMLNHTGWFSKEDAVLVMDKNGNGLIDSLTEVFSEIFDPSSKSALEALKLFDTNDDGVFNSQDVQFTEVKIWQDINQNGISEEGELKTLNEVGISKINLSGDAVNVSDENGNQILTSTSSFETTDRKLLSLEVALKAGGDDYIDDGKFKNFDKYVDSHGKIMVINNTEENVNFDLASANAYVFLSSVGNDVIYTSGSAKINVFAGSGNDSITGNGGDDLLSGGEGNDIINGKGGNDLLYGGAGDDVFVIDKISGAVTTIDGFEAKNLVEKIDLSAFDISNIVLVANKDGVTIDLGDSQKLVLINLNLSNLTSRSFIFKDGVVPTLKYEEYGTDNSEIVVGSNFDDTVHAGGGSNYIVSGLGNDIIYTNPDMMDVVKITPEAGKVDVIYGFDNYVKTELTYWMGQFHGDRTTGKGLVTGGTTPEQWTERTHYTSFVNTKFDLTSFNNIDDLNDLPMHVSGNDTIIELGNGQQIILKDYIQKDDFKTYTYGRDWIGWGGTEHAQFITDYDIVKYSISSSNFIFNTNGNIMGSLIDDNLYGTDGNDVLDGGEGNDIILGYDGVDIIIASMGDDYIEGGAGNDGINAGFGNDEVYGGDGNDIIIGQAGNDILYGDNGDDIIMAGVGNDTVYGGFGSDTYIFNLGDGNDIIIDNAEDEVVDVLRMKGDITKESLVLTKNGNDLVITFKNNSVDKITIKDQYLGNGIEIIRLPDNTDIPVETMNLTIFGSIGNDTLFGTEKDDIINGGLGNDLLKGGEGNDVYIFNAGDGQDIIDETGMFSNADVIRLGVGINPSSVTHEKVGNDLLIHFSDNPDDLITIKNHYTNDNSRIEKILFANGDEIDLVDAAININGSAGNNIIRGTAYNDNIYGGEGDDILEGGAGADYLDGGAGDDVVSYRYSLSSVSVNLIYNTVSGGDGNGDVFVNIEGAEGSEFNDSLTGNDIGNRLYGLGGEDLIYGNGGNDKIYGGSGDDTVYGDDGDDYIDGGDGADFLDGGAGNDSIFGSAGGDTIYGGDGDDYLSGGTEGDYIDGGNGNDRLTTGFGDDIMFGGAGSDIFTISKSAGVEQIIKDYEISDDNEKIDLWAFSQIKEFADLKMNQSGFDTLIDLGNDQILRIKNVSVEQLNANDFIFRQDPKEFIVNNETDGYQIKPSISELDNGNFVITWLSTNNTDSKVSIKGRVFEADGTPQGSEFAIATDVGSYYGSVTNVNLKVIGLSGGKMAVTWESYTDSFGYKINAQLLNSSGELQGSIFQFANRADGGYVSRYDPNITELDNGNLAVVWNGYSANDNKNGVYAQIFDQNGIKIGSEVTIANGQVFNGINALSFSDVNIAALNNGSFVTTWGVIYRVDDNKSTDYYVDYMQITAGDGSAIGETSLLSSGVRYYEGSEHISEGITSQRTVDTLANGNFVVTWRQNDDSYHYNDEKIVGQVFNDKGDVLGVPFEISAPSWLKEKPEITAMDDGGFVVTWSMYNNALETDSSEGIYAQRFRFDGLKLGEVYHVNDTTANAQLHPDIAQLESGDFVITWDSQAIYDHLPEKTDIFAKIYGAEEVVVNHPVYSHTTLVNKEFILQLPVDTFLDVSGNPLSYKASLANGLPLPDWLSFNPNTMTFKGTPDNADIGSIGIRITASNGQNYITDSFNIKVDKPVVMYEDPASTPEILVNTVTENNQSTPNMTKLPDGSYIVVWQNQLGDNLFNIKGQKFDRVGNKVGAEFSVVDDANAERIYDPVVHSLSNGESWVSWRSEGTISASIFIQKIDENGVKIGDSFTVQADNTTHSYDIDIAELSNGNVAVTWYGWLVYNDGASSTDANVYNQIFNINGNAITSIVQVNPSEGDTAGQYRSHIEALENGNYVISYIGFQGNIKFQIFDNLGNKIGGEISSDVSASYMDSAALKNGGFVIVSGDTLVSNEADNIYAQVFDASGNKTSDIFLVNSETDFHQNSPSVAVLDNGHFVIAWFSINEDGSKGGVYGQAFDENGNRLGSEFQINDYTKNGQLYPSISALDSNRFAVSWQSNGQDGSGQGIYTKTFAESSYGVVGEKIILEGSDDRDVIHSTELNDIMAGHAGDDIFVITKHEGNIDIIKDFTVDDLHDVISDRIDLTEFTNIRSFSDLKMYQDVTKDYPYIIIELGDDQFLHVKNVKLSSHILPDHFIFYNPVNTHPQLLSGVKDMNIIVGDNLNFTIADDAFFDFEGDKITYSASLANGSPLPEWLTFDSTNNSFIGTPANSDIGNIDIKLSASDGLDISDTFFKLSVNGALFALNTNKIIGYVDDANILMNDLLVTSTSDNMTLTITLSNTDYGVLNTNGVTSQNGILILSGSADEINASLVNLSFVPNNNFNDEIEISTILHDGINPDFIGNILIKPNEEPVAKDDYFLLENSNSITINSTELLINDSDSEDIKPWFDGIITNPQHGILQLDSEGNYIYTPDDNFNGVDSFVYGVKDSSGMQSTATAFINVVTDPLPQPVALEGSLRGDVIYGSEGYDVIKGRGGNDILHGLGGDDNIYGGLGNDKLIGGSGSDHLDGGKGTDGAKYEGSDAGVKIDLGLGEVSGGYAEGDVLVNIENIFGSEHADILTGDEKANKIFGNDGEDVISGGSGRDVIRGDGGDDIITGGFGNDVLTGGSGADLFVYENVGDSVDGSSDLIKGFNVNDDAIDLVALATFGIDSFDDLVITQDSASGRTIIGVNADNVDVAAHDFEIALKGLINIDQDNFHFG